MRTRDNIIQDMARTLTVTSVADGVDAGAIGDDYSPGPGGDWMNTVDGIDPNALDMCKRFASNLEERLDLCIVDMEAQWKAAARYRHDDFGHLLVMQSLGHGVGLSDDIYGDAPEWMDKLWERHDLEGFTYYNLDETIWPFAPDYTPER